MCHTKYIFFIEFRIYGIYCSCFLTDNIATYWWSPNVRVKRLKSDLIHFLLLCPCVSSIEIIGLFLPSRKRCNSLLSDNLFAAFGTLRVREPGGHEPSFVPQVP